MDKRRENIPADIPPAVEQELRGRINLALSLLNHRPHHPDDDALVRLVTSVLEGVPFDVLRREAV